MSVNLYDRLLSGGRKLKKKLCAVNYEQIVAQLVDFLKNTLKLTKNK
jgi:hypothetical protein